MQNKKNDCVYVSGNLFNLGRCRIKNFKRIPELFFKAILEVIGNNGTIIVPTHILSSKFRQNFYY